ncbi:DNA-binding bromodomain-containing protein isoform X2 [Tasmannia lanceolata]|uniref:DNA-binding bromodomain-containing protein isoform X2 n=1 Tax=Tasmannia lanceolata TaxID=3420 RepID=UPI004063E34C
MKRKRGPRAGDKKGKRKELVLVSNDIAPNLVSLNTQDNSGFDDIDDGQLNSTIDIEAPSPGPDKLSNAISTGTDGLNNKPAGQSGHGRVKVKLKSSKMLEPHHTFSDSQMPNDMDKNNPQMALEKHSEVMEKKEENTSRKAGTVKIKSSRVLGSTSVIMQDKYMNNPNSSVQTQGERTHALLDIEKTIDLATPRESHQRETKLPHQDYRYNKEELITALGVIKKIMKMDAAEPFNAPVNPIALGIPDYFDIIETPMDFSTICNHLQLGDKYMNSEDVFRDVQFIWENCYRYNNKGDYILDLMKRVKKNFTKHWMAAGLYCDPLKRDNDASFDQDSGSLECWQQEDDHERDKAPEVGSRRKIDVLTSKLKTFQNPILDGRIKGIESKQLEDAVPSNQEKVHVKSNSTKHKMRRRYGISHHKSDCLCAVCVVRRRRKEREGNAQLVDNQSEINDGNLTQEFKQEGNSLLDNPSREDGSPYLDNSPEADVDADVEEQGDEFKLENIEQLHSFEQENLERSKNEIEFQKKGENGSSGHDDDATDEDSNQQPQALEVDSEFLTQESNQKDDRPVQDEEHKEETAFQHHQEAKQMQGESPKIHHQTQMHEDTPLHENPSIMRLCETLFPKNPRSVWCGPHSLIRRHHVSVRDSPIHAAVTMFMK